MERSSLVSQKKRMKEKKSREKRGNNRKELTKWLNVALFCALAFSFALLHLHVIVLSSNAKWKLFATMVEKIYV